MEVFVIKAFQNISLYRFSLKSVSEFGANPFMLMKRRMPVCEIGILFVTVADLKVFSLRSCHSRSPASRALIELSELCCASP